MNAPDTADLLRGLREIGRYLRMTDRQAKYLISLGGMPVFRMGRTVCARRARLDEWLARQEGPDPI